MRFQNISFRGTGSQHLMLHESNIQRRVMAKGKDVRVKVILEGTICVRKSLNKGSRGVSRYITQKNRHNTPSRLEL
ncbi:50S ribosomal protein L33 chloroplastic [Bienertia sinuspersici]